MISLAIDTATSRCSIAASRGKRVVARHIDGPRNHARSVLSLTDEVLEELGAGVGDVNRIITGDGPGSFTGLRVAAAVAKALCWQRKKVTWEVAPSLRARAVAHLPENGGKVLALSDALRGELYAGCWRLTATTVDTIAEPEGAMPPAALEEMGPFDVVVGSIPEPLVEVVARVTGVAPVTGEAALPDARMLLRLAGMAGGTTPIFDPSGWQPRYGRPAEAQAVWERKHGRPLPASTHRRG